MKWSMCMLLSAFLLSLSASGSGGQVKLPGLDGENLTIDRNALPRVAEQITRELTRTNNDPIGLPLPVAAHWNTGSTSSSHSGWDPDFVMSYLDAGNYVIPTFELSLPTLPSEP